MGKLKGIELSLKHLKDSNFGKIPDKQNAAVVGLADPHVQSFNFALGDGLHCAVADVLPLEFTLLNDKRVTIAITSVEIGRPMLPGVAGESGDRRLFPRECVERGCTYSAPATALIEYSLDGGFPGSIKAPLGDLPIMVKSKFCNLHGLSPKQLVARGELVNETGGYFIINGACRVLRMLIANRRNFPIAMSRESWKKRDDHFSGKGLLMRCVQADQTSAMNVLHYLTTGMAKLEFVLRREMFFVPLVMCLRALMPYTDLQIYQHLTRGREDDMYFSENVKDMLRELQEEGLHTQEQCQQYIGQTFRHRLSDIPPWYTSTEVCTFLFKRCVLVHLGSNQDKFNTLCMMARKLFTFVKGECCMETVDGLNMQEVQLGGHTFLQYLKEKLEDILTSMRTFFYVKNRNEGQNWVPNDGDFKRAAQRSKSTGEVFKTFIATGSLKSRTGCGVMQTTGLTVVFDHLNRMRDLSHLRAVHRGAFFVDMKTIEPRRLTGEAWGFICPVHTPDGAPCGLLNHLAQDCVVLNEVPVATPATLTAMLAQLGMTPMTALATVAPGSLEVMVDGCLVGYVRGDQASTLTQQLRLMKTNGRIFPYTEVVHIGQRKYGGQYPGLFLASAVGRMVRPVVNLLTLSQEYVGTLEQLYLNVAVTPEEVQQEVHTHVELSKTAIFSNVGKLVPFSDCNPNPRNMYQCQMGKQTMGTPVHNWRCQTNSKLYRLLYPQVPLVRNSHYDNINMEEFCMGFNAVVAIISYTGYDMEDAMVLNKCAMERGLAHGQIYKTEFVDLTELQGKRRGSGGSEVTHLFRRDPKDDTLKKFLDSCGLPYPGTKLSTGDPYYCVYDVAQRTFRLIRYKGEDCVVDKYTIMSASLTPGEVQRVSITIRVRRNPIIGDKFASRSGQKGVMSRLYPTEDLPFSERGIIPDIIFNPHGIPSRMTAGKLIELIAGKSAAEFGKSFDSTPFAFSDENPASDYFGKILEKAGFNYYGEDVLYSGIDGRMIEVEIFEGIIYYQRLRHMTADKWQVRSVGAVDLVTRQPVKGRKRGGAIRFGEMERDCLISHGAAYTLKDRLFDCSDPSNEWVCESCGGLLSIGPGQGGGGRVYGRVHPECLTCGPAANVSQVGLPFAFKYLITELASVGIKTRLGLQGAGHIISPSTSQEEPPGRDSIKEPQGEDSTSQGKEETPSPMKVEPEEENMSD